MKTASVKKFRKIFTVVTTLALGVSAQAQASWFYTYASTFVSPGYVQASVVNQSYRVATECQVEVMGLRRDGIWVNSFSRLFVPAGGYQYAYVYTQFVPFVDGRAVAMCRYLGY